MFILHFRRYFQALCKQKENKEVLGIEQKVTLGHFHKAAILQSTGLCICSPCWTARTCGEEFGTKSWDRLDPDVNLREACSLHALLSWIQGQLRLLSLLSVTLL